MTLFKVGCSVPAGAGTIGGSGKDYYSEFTLKAYRDNIPLGMFLSVEENAKKIMASPRDASFRRIPRGCGHGGKDVFLPRDTSLTGCKNGTRLTLIHYKIQSKHVRLDSDVAMFYGVDTNDVTQAVKRNLDKFPEGYIIGLTESEKKEVATNCGNPKIKFSPALPKAFTEKGLYMLATILKSERATATTIAIVEAFAKMRELSAAVAELVKSPDDTQRQAAVSLKSGEILSDMVTKELRTTGTETTYELNLLSAVKIKHTVKKEAQ